MKQMTVQQFQAIYEAAIKTYNEDIERTSALVAAYLCISIDEAEKLPRNKYTKAASEVGNIVAYTPKPIHSFAIWIGVTRYYIAITPKSSTVAHQRVLEYCQDPENGGIIKNMHLALSALSEPGKLFGLLSFKETDQERAEKFKKYMPFNRAYGYLLFFCELTPNLLRVTASEMLKQSK